MLVICEVCDNNVIDELSARKGETVCKLCQEEIKREVKEEAKKNRIKICKVCGFEGHHSKFKKNTMMCKKCYAAKMRKYREEHPEKMAEYTKPISAAQKEYNHSYYLAHKKESLERTRRNRAKKKECT